MAGLVGRRWGTVVLAVLLTASLIVLAPGRAAASSGVSVSGTIRSSASGSTPVPNAEVAISTSSAGGPVVSTTTTNGSGQYSSVVPQNANYIVSVIASGYVDGAKGVSVSASPVTDDIALTPASFSGVVTDTPSGNAVSAETVELLHSSDGTTYAELDSTSTDRDGNFAFPASDLGTGDYKLEYSSPAGSYGTTFYDGQPGGANSITGATALTAEPAGGANMALVPSAGEITGTISDTAGAVDGATVEVFARGSTSDPIASTVVSNQGTYVLSGLISGSYVLKANPPTQTGDVPTWSGDVGDPYTATILSVTSPNATTGANIQLAPGGTLSGTITAPGGGGVSGVDVDVDDAGGRPVYTGVTDTSGAYTLTGVAPGVYYVYFDASETDAASNSNFASQWYGATSGASDSLEQSSAVAVNVTSGAAVTVNQQLALGGSVTGIVTDATSGVGLSGVIQIYNASGTYLTAVFSSATGTFTISGLPAGNYYLFYGGDDWFSDTNSTVAEVNDAYGWYGGSSLAESLNSATPVTVAGGGSSTTANASLPASGAIAGTVTAGSSPQQGVSIGLYDSAGNLISAPSVVAASSLADGTYEIQHLLPGAYKVEFAASGANLGIQYYNNSTSESAATTVTVSAGQTAQGINASLIAGGQISGTVTNATNNAALPGITVDLFDAQGHVLEATTTLNDGSYTLAGVPSGSYYVGFDPTGAYANAFQAQYYSNSQVLSASTAVSVSTGQTTHNINAALLPATTPPQTKTATTTTTTTTPVPYPIAYPVAVAPTLTAAQPTIAGTLKVGDKLAAKTAGWTTGTAFSYRWFAGGTAIKGATGPTITLTSAEFRKAVTVKVLGMLSGYNWVTETSLKTKVVVAGTLRSAVPTISGTAKAGDKLTAKTGTWTKGTTFAYQWYANRKAIKNATKSTLKLSAAQRGTTIRVKVTGELTGYQNAQKTSRATTRIVG